MFREVLAKLGFGSLDQACQISLRSLSRSSCPFLCNASHLIIKDLIQILSDLLHGSILNAYTECLCIREGQEFVGVIGISHGTRSQMLNESRSINCGPVRRHYSSNKLVTLRVVTTFHHQSCNAAVGVGIAYRRIRQIVPLSSNLICKTGQFLQGIHQLNVSTVLGFTIQTGHWDCIIQCIRITESLNNTQTTQHL